MGTYLKRNSAMWLVVNFLQSQSVPKEITIVILCIGVYEYTSNRHVLAKRH